MKVFKFGGASVRNAQAIRNVAGILKPLEGEKIIVVVSAMGKTTNALEKVLSEFHAGKNWQAELDKVATYHMAILKELFTANHLVWSRVNEEFSQIKSSLNPAMSRAELYDKIVSQGEVLSSLIVFEYLQQQEIPVTWVDA